MANLQLIKGLIEKKNWSIEQFGEKIGLKRGSVYNIIAENSTKIETLEKIAEVLNVPITIFFEDSTLTGNIQESSPDYSGINRQPSSVDNLIKQNGDLIKQVSDLILMQNNLINMQVINAESIRNLSGGNDTKNAGARRYG